MAIQIDPNTGERITDAPQIDPLTGERVVSGPTPAVDMSNVAGAQGPLPTPTAPAVNMTPSAIGSAYDSAPANIVKGAIKSIPATMSGIAKLMPGTSDAWQPLDSAAQTHGTAQAIGKGVGNAAQFLIPGAAEEKLGLYGASKLPMLGKYATPIAKLGASALGSGTVNAAQGGSFGAGAGAGLTGGLIGQGMQKVAPMLAESALGVRAADRAFNRTPGQAILAETTGIKPGVIANQATQKVGQLNNELQSAAASSPMTASLAPARQVVDDAYILIQIGVQRILRRVWRDSTGDRRC